jgi:hypothetical protein
MNRTLLRIFFFLLLLPLSQRAFAQCQYTLQMEDSFGDGWNGGTIVVTNGPSLQNYTLLFGDGDTVSINVTDGQPLLFVWVPGTYDNEVSFTILDSEGNVVAQYDPAPPAGIFFSGTADCATCYKPTSLSIENVYDTRVKLRWTPSPDGNPAVSWQVIYGPQGFVPGPGVGDTATVTTPKVTLNNLQKKTWYDAYVVQNCGGNDYSQPIGPISFETYWTNDVGIAGVATPVSGCNLGLDTVRIFMRNYGAAPQSLIPFRYSVNGVDAGVPQPEDGFYTGVLGKDSSELIIFETEYDFSAPGEYLITVYTEMGGDEDVSNDTFYYYITNRLEAPLLQQFENWGGGWAVDEESNFPSWAHGAPNKLGVPAAADGSKAWFTNLTGPHNFNERSFLVSPCLDFSNLSDDPVVEFSLIHDIDNFYDGLYLELSVDNGDTWEKVGDIGEGLNWYNTENFGLNLGAVWAGISEDWVRARHSLPGVAGESEVRLRFVFRSGPFTSNPGAGIDGFSIYVPLANDLAGLTAATAGEGSECGLESDEITFFFGNFGTQPQSFFQVAYSVNGSAPVIENVGATTVLPDEVYEYTFLAPFDSRDAISEIKCWTIVDDELAPANDTAYYTVSHVARPVPFQENFESSLQVPEGWAVTNNFFVTNAHNNISNVLAINMYGSTPAFTIDLPRYGLINTGDSLRFDYRITDWSAGTNPTTLSGDTKIEVQISTNCGETFSTVYTISNLTHTPSVALKTRYINLSNYAGQAIIVRFKGTWISGDFWFDLDNVGLLACAADMGLTATVVPAGPGQTNGSATVNVALGNPPYTYLWSNNTTNATATSLPNGPISVTVTDAIGCSDVLNLTIGTSATNDIEGLRSFALFPNPTEGRATFKAVFEQPVEATLEVVNLLGQRVWASDAQRATDHTFTLDLVPFADGLYLVRLSAEGQAMTQKLLKNR